MTIKFSVFIATSMDGYIARKNGDLDWLPGSDGTRGEEDFGYTAFFQSIDTLVMGRNTYALASSFSEWPYHGKKVWVLSSAYPHSGTPLAHEAKGLACAPLELGLLLEQNGAQHVYVDGGKTIQSFLRAELIQELTLTRIPVLIGEGIPLFGQLAGDIKLRHLATQVFSNGFVQSKYALEYKASKKKNK